VRVVCFPWPFGLVRREPSLVHWPRCLPLHWLHYHHVHAHLPRGDGAAGIPVALKRNPHGTVRPSRL
jgi:hypothetical protein